MQAPLCEIRICGVLAAQERRSCASLRTESGNLDDANVLHVFGRGEQCDCRAHVHVVQGLTARWRNDADGVDDRVDAVEQGQPCVGTRAICKIDAHDFSVRPEFPRALRVTYRESQYMALLLQ